MAWLCSFIKRVRLANMASLTWETVRFLCQFAWCSSAEDERHDKEDEENEEGDLSGPSSGPFELGEPQNGGNDSDKQE